MMATEREETLSVQQAEAVWGRAAQLQAEAAQRVEERSRSRLMAGTPPEPHPDAYTRDEVRAAAADAGIAGEYVELALAQLSAPRESAVAPADDRAASRFLGVAQRALVVSGVVDRPTAEVYDVMRRVLPAHPWYLSLRDSRGDPLSGGMLVFDVPGYVEAHQTPLAMHAMSVGVTQLEVTLRPLHGRCEVLVSAGLGGSVRRNFTAARWWTGIAGGIGAGGAAAAAAAVGAAGAVLALPAAGGAALLAALAAAGYRAGYRHSLRKLGETLERLLQSVDVQARTGGAFIPTLPALPAGRAQGGTGRDPAAPIPPAILDPGS